MPSGSINDEIGGNEYAGENSGIPTGDINGGGDFISGNNNARNLGFDLSFLKSPTGEGSIEDYLDSPLNFNSSRSMARIIRGLSGMLGSLDLAIVDIFVGALDYLKSRKASSHD
jgi:hypothetical protein